MRIKVHVIAALLLAGAAGAAAAQQPARTIDPAWFAGTWSDRADCSGAVQFLRDGRYVTARGEARWSIERGNVLVLTNGERRQELPIERINERQVRIIANGIISYRCPDSAAPRR